MEEIAKTLASVELFQDLDDSKAFCKSPGKCRRADYLKGQEIVSYQDTTTDVYFIEVRSCRYLDSFPWRQGNRLSSFS